MNHTEQRVATDWVFAISGAALPGQNRTRFAALWDAAVNYLVPIGYEDFDGFHYGEPPQKNLALHS
jgi:hypothetical protein